MLEREMKFAVDDRFEIPDLDDVVAGVRIGPPVEVHNEDTYYDTDDLRLLRWGCTFRHRKRKGWTVKLPVSSTGAIVRDEISFRGRAGSPPGDALAVVESFSRGRPLGVIARVQTERTVRVVTTDSGELLVELADDRATAQATDGSEVSFRQVEAELGPTADPGLLDEITRRLTEAGALPDTDGVKVVKALGQQTIDQADVVIPPLGKRPPARVVIQRALARSVIQLISELPAALVGDDPRGVHKARVATRRLRSDLRTFEPLLEQEWATAVRRDLRPLAAHLGAIRDADVLLSHFSETMANHQELDNDDAQPLLDLLVEQRQTARASLRLYVGGGNVSSLLDRLVAGVADPPTNRSADERADEQLRPLVRKRWRKLDKTVRRLGDDPGPVALHDARILVKRTRYASAAVTDAFGAPSRSFAKSLARVQDRLGERNDAMVAEDWLVANASQLPPRAAFTAGRLAQLVRTDAVTDQDRWIEPYRTATRKRNRSWFA